MKNICLNFIKRFLQLKRKSKELFFTLINSLKKDFSFYNSHTELLAIWTVLFMTITGLFAVGLKRKIAIILFLYALSLIITLITSVLTIYYLHAIKYHKEKQLLPKIHNFLNKSFKLRALLRFIKIPSFKYLIKRNF